MFDARPPLTNMMVSSKQKRRSWTGNTFSSDACISQRKGEVLCISENTQDKARKCEIAGRLGSSEQEAGGDVWAFAEADSESGKEPWQAGKWLTAKILFLSNENVWAGRPAGWGLGLCEVRGSDPSDQSRVRYRRSLISSSSIYPDQHCFQAAITLQALRERRRARRRQRAQ